LQIQLLRNNDLSPLWPESLWNVGTSDTLVTRD
jgi:hypothetical protein